ncbi:patatin-like phospholipase family protein [Burkholderia ubonensis]|uniref:patatin-like phospholipase family protein n=1 Tax=Burkholderia ubonensis TaxID=101571 RepID=UPI0039F4C61D
MRGNRLQALLANWTAAVPANQLFDRLPIPYLGIATDLQTGQKVVLDHGSLPLAIRASMALPGLFSPTEIDGRTLVDGGLVNNLSVDAAHRMGADVVIAVDIGSPLRPLNALTSPADVMLQMMGILIRQNVAEQRKQLQTDDILLQPDLGKQTFTDFQNASQGSPRAKPPPSQRCRGFRATRCRPSNTTRTGPRTRGRRSSRSTSRRSRSGLTARRCRSRSCATRCT